MPLALKQKIGSLFAYIPGLENMNLWAVVGVGLLLGACAGSPLRTAMTSPEERTKEDDAKCQDFGAAPGTQAYFDCRMRLDERRAQMMAEYRRDLSNTRVLPAPQPVSDLSGYSSGLKPYTPPPPSTYQARNPITCTSQLTYGQVTTTTCR